MFVKIFEKFILENFLTLEGFLLFLLGNGVGKCLLQGTTPLSWARSENIGLGSKPILQPIRQENTMQWAEIHTIIFCKSHRDHWIYR